LGRMKALFKNPEEFPAPEEIIKATEEKLMSAGLSRAKAKAVKDLAVHVTSGILPLREKAHLMTDIELIEACSKVRGIGRWTSEMFLIFTLGRIDVLPIHDFGVRKGFMKVYNKRRMPTPKELDKYGERWKPYRSVASWYMWRALEI
jgi:DNA-3-methyladenine glycosylase II